jgi:hypothetical protein
MLGSYFRFLVLKNWRDFRSLWGEIVWTISERAALRRFFSLSASAISFVALNSSSLFTASAWCRSSFAADEWQLAEVATDSLTHSDESTVDVAGRRAHSSRYGQGNQGNNQQILDQSLTTLVVVKSLQQSKHSGQFVLSPLQK